jgi:hypothetical protein
MPPGYTSAPHNAIQGPLRQSCIDDAHRMLAPHHQLSQSYPESMSHLKTWHTFAYDATAPTASVQSADGFECMPLHANTIHGYPGYFQSQALAGANNEKTVRGGNAMQQLSAIRSPAIDVANPLKPDIIRATRCAPTGCCPCSVVALVAFD